jgi:hypothetical protein
LGRGVSKGLIQHADSFWRIQRRTSSEFDLPPEYLHVYKLCAGAFDLAANFPRRLGAVLLSAEAEVIFKSS